MRWLTVFAMMLAVSSFAAADTLSQEAINASAKYLGVREISGRNDHPLINKWAAEVGLNNKAQLRATGCGFSWCLLFVHGCYQEAADKRGNINPLPKIAGVQNLYIYAKANEGRFKLIDQEDIIAGIERVPPGAVMIMLHKGGKGHTGMNVKQETNWVCNTREGNTNKAGSREGDGVYNKVRNVSTIEAFIVPRERIAK